MEPDDFLNPCAPFPPDLADGSARAFPAEWRTEAVVGLARGIAEDGAFERLPILADALEEAGCTDDVLLQHCREPMVHCADCWAVNLALDRLPGVEPEPSLPTLSIEQSRPTPVVGDHERDTTELTWWQRGISLAGLLCVLALVSASRTRQDTSSLPTNPVSPIIFAPKPNTAAELLANAVKSRKSVPLRDLENGRAGSWLDRRVNAAASKPSSSR